MALVLDDRVKETSTTTGTGTLNLSGAVSGFQTFVAGVGDGNTTYYAIINRDEAEWETGVGTVTDATTDTLARTTVIASSNSDSAVTFSAGTKDVFTTLPASKAVFEDASSDVTLPNDLILGSDSAVLKFGADSDTTLTHTDGTGLTLNSTNKLLFRDTGLYIYSSTDGQLDIVADTEVQIAATTIDINGAIALNGAITGATNITLSGELDAATLDVSGNADIDGTTNLDAVDIDGAVQLDATLTIGANDQGYDVILYGDTASANMTWDTSADDLIFNGGAGLIVPDGQFTLGSTAVTSTAAEINLLDTASANSVVNSKAVIYGSSGELAGTLSTVAQTNITSLGTLTALTVDDIAINGKVVTMTGSSSDTAVFTAGTNGTLSIVTTDAAAAAANIQITADGTVDIDSAGVLTLDSGAAINIEPAAGSAILLDGTISVDAGVVTGATSITSTAFVGDITGDVTGNTSGTAATVTTAAQTNITSLGTLTTLTVDNVIINGTTIGHTSDTDLITLGSAIATVAGEVSMTTLDIGGTNVTSTAAELNILDGVTSTATELNYSDLTTLGTSAASKVLSADSNNLTKITGGVYLEEDTLTFDATQDWDVRASPVAQVTLTANVTFDAPSNPTTGQYISILCIQDGTGSRTIAWNAVFEFTGGTAPTATTTAAKGDLFTFRYHNSHWIEVGRNLNLTRA